MPLNLRLTTEERPGRPIVRAFFSAGDLTAVCARMGRAVVLRATPEGRFTLAVGFNLPSVETAAPVVFEGTLL